MHRLKLREQGQRWLDRLALVAAGQPRAERRPPKRMKAEEVEEHEEPFGL